MGRNLVQWDEHEGALGQARVRNHEARPANNKIAEQENIQIERARAIGKAHEAIATEVLLDEEHGAEQFEWSQFGLECHGSVEKARLIQESDRLSGEER